MGHISIACYRPKEGKADELIEIVKGHVPVLLKEQLVTTRPPVIMQATDGTIIEVFEWVSGEAVMKAHNVPAVMELWAKFNEACDYVAPNALTECQHIFPGFKPIN